MPLIRSVRPLMKSEKPLMGCEQPLLESERTLIGYEKPVVGRGGWIDGWMDVCTNRPTDIQMNICTDILKNPHMCSTGHRPHSPK
jgi:hypothetical protein